MTYRVKRTLADKAQLRHLAWVTTRHGKTLLYYRHNGRNTRIYADPIEQPAEFRRQYDRAAAGQEIKDGYPPRNPAADPGGGR